ncbi:MAG: hypothetical protein RH917_17070 [Lacipirellulaceae bacterium]
MKLSIVDRNECLDGKSRDYAERRLRFALSRFHNKIDDVILVLSDLNGPKGGVDQHCKLLVKLKRSSEIVITDSDSDLLTCIARTAERAGRTVSRAIDRNRMTKRRRRTSQSEPPWVPSELGLADAMLPASA